jgi:hypothetical protein
MMSDNKTALRPSAGISSRVFPPPDATRGVHWPRTISVPEDLVAALGAAGATERFEALALTT